MKADAPLDSDALPSDPSPLPPRPLPVLGRPWFWVLLIGTLFTVPLWKSGQAELPPVLPGADRDPLTFELPDETGAPVSLDLLEGHLKVITELPLASGDQTEATFAGIRRLRKRLRGLGSMVVYVVLCKGGDGADLSALLDAKTARKPVNVFLLDPEGQTAADLRLLAGSQTADFFLADRHGRLRGLYANTESDLDRLVAHCGQLANWPDSDPPPGD